LDHVPADLREILVENVKHDLRKIPPDRLAEHSLLAESEKSWEDAARAALEEASKSIRHIRSIIDHFPASAENGRIAAYRVNAKISFDLESP
jgi:dodecin